METGSAQPTALATHAYRISGATSYPGEIWLESRCWSDWKGSTANQEYIFFGGRRSANRQVSGVRI